MVLSLILTLGFTSCSQSANESEPFITVPELPESVGDDSLLRGKTLKIFDVEEGISYYFFDEDGTGLVFGKDRKALKMEFHYSYNDNTKLLALVLDRIANSEGVLCTAEELCSPEEIEKMVDDQLDLLYFFYLLMSPKQRQEEGLPANATKNQLMKFYYNQIADELIDTFKYVFSTPQYILIENYNEETKNGESRAYTLESTNLLDLLNFEAITENQENLKFEKVFGNTSTKYTGKIRIGYGTYDILDVSENELITDFAALPYKKSWNDGKIILEITFNENTYVYKEKQDISEFQVLDD